MPRRRLGVALLLPPPLDGEIDGLRRACGDRQLGRVPAHCTLVPPVNVRDDDLGSVLAILRGAAARTGGPIELHVGPPASFHPDSPTLHLPVADGDGALRALRDAVFVGPLERTTTWPFVAHVTLADEIDDDRARAAIAALADYTACAPIDRLHLLEQQPHPAGGRRWVPIADVVFAKPAIVGRGGIEIELTVSELVDPRAAAVVSSAASLPDGARSVVVTARRHGEVVGVLTGWMRDDDELVVERRVAEPHRGMGIGRHLTAAFDAHVARTRPR